MKKFFVACNLDFETELEAELGEIWPFLLGLDGKSHSESLNLVERVPGGLVIENSFHLGLQLNFFSKLANRILLRLAEFRVRDFPKLFQKLQDLKKDPLLVGKKFQFEVAASQSRLNNEKRIREILIEVFGPEPKISDGNGIATGIDAGIDTLYVRIHDDHCSISLDTSGIHLHKRSELWKTGPAPLRETLAAFCGRKLIEGLTFTDLRDFTLIDPMAGTGTLLLETALLWQPSPRHDFPFLNWKQTPKILLSPSLRKGYAVFPKIFKGVRALDQDPEILKVAQDRLQASGLEFQVEAADLMKTAIAKEGPCLVISNPPYGERMQAHFKPLELLEQIDQIYRPRRIGLLFSEAQMRLVRKEIQDLKQTKSNRSFEGASQKPLQISHDFPFKNGGLAVHFMIFSRRV